MTKKQLQTLLDYIDARISEMIVQSDSRDALNEAIHRAECAKDLMRVFNFDDETRV